MKKVESTHSKQIDGNELAMYVEASVTGKLDGKEITEEDRKHLERIGKRSVNLDELVRTTTVIVDSQLNQVSSLVNLVDLIMVIMSDELGVTEEQINKAVDKLNKERDAYIKEKQEEVRKRQEEFKQQDNNNDDEKVIELKPKND